MQAARSCRACGPVTRNESVRAQAGQGASRRGPRWPSSRREGLRQAAPGVAQRAAPPATQHAGANLQEALFEAYWKKQATSGPSTGKLEDAGDAASRLTLAVMLEESHESLSSSDFDSLSSCPHCRYPCHLSGVPPCSPCDYLKTWREEAYLKPPGHDSSLKLALPCGIDAAVVSAGGRLQTWKPENQDVYFMQSLALPGSNGASLAADPWAAGAALGSAAEAGLATPALAVGVFDGHGRLGKHAAQHVRDSMQSSLLRQQRELMSTTQEPCGAGGAGAASPHALMSLALRQGFDTAARSIAASSRDFSKSGCTAVVCGVTPEAVTAVWTGDSRAVLGICSSGGSSTIAMSLTDDHKPGRPEERARITAAGGRVDRTATDHNGKAIGPFRVFLPNAWVPGLALSRAFGDFIVSDVGVISTPDIMTLEFSAAAAAAASTAAALADGCLAPNSAVTNVEMVSPLGSGSWDDSLSAGADRHVLIIASDGLWEWVPNASAVRIASSFERAEDAAHALVEAAQKHWAVRYAGRNCDDITVAVIFLPADPAAPQRP